MIIFILPGYSPQNKDWAEETAKNLKVDGTIRPIFWDHWEGSTEKFVAEEKAHVIAKHAKGDKIIIIAKSIGTLVASYVIREIPDQIVKVVFCGIPVNDIEQKNADFIKESAIGLKDKLLIFQNADDPHGSFDQVKDFGKVISKPRSDHSYPYYEDFNNYLTS